MKELSIPTVDLSVFFKDGADEEAKAATKELINQACMEYGFFQAVNHGVPLDLMSRAMEITKSFFAEPDEVKRKYQPPPNAHTGGYGRREAHEKNEFFMFAPPKQGFVPSYPPNFRYLQEELYGNFRKTGEVMLSIINDCLGLPPNFLKDEYLQNKIWDLVSAKHYFPATETDNVGIPKHEDGNIFTFVYQDGVGGLEVLKDQQWIPVVPTPGILVVNVGDIVQVLTNKKFKSATHRVVRSEGRSRYSFLYFHGVDAKKWIEPLPQFTTDVGDAPKYRGFVYQDYMELRVRNKTHPPANPDDEINIVHYEIST